MPPDAQMDRPEFSVIITCYYEEQSILEFHERLTKALQSLGRTFEIVMVNDGSTDATFERLKSIFEKDAHVTTIVDLFRNTGQPCAMAAGIAHARGKDFIFMDSDLQLDPDPRMRFGRGGSVILEFLLTGVEQSQGDGLDSQGLADLVQHLLEHIIQVQGGGDGGG